MGEWVAHSWFRQTTEAVRAVRHITRASSSPMLPNTVLTWSQHNMAETGFENQDTVVGYLSGFELHLWQHNFAHPWTGSD